MLLLMGKFITDQILGMKWLNTLIGNLLGTLGLDVTSRIGGSIQFLDRQLAHQAFYHVRHGESVLLRGV